MQHTTIIATFATLVLFGCGVLAPGHKAYVAPTLRVDAGKTRLMAAIERAARAEGWSILTRHYRLGLVEVVSPADRIGDARTREHWYFFAGDRRVRARLIFEARFAGGHGWVSSPDVCDDYGYLRERQQLARIRRLAGPA